MKQIQPKDLKEWDTKNPRYLMTVQDVNSKYEMIQGFTDDPIQATCWIFEMRQREPVTRKWIARVRKQITMYSGQSMKNGEKILTRTFGKIIGTWKPKKYVCPSKKHFKQLRTQYHCDFCGEHGRS